MVKQQCLFGTLLSIKVPGRHFLVPESWRKGVKMTEPNRQSGEKEVLEPGGINHSESSRNNQSELIRNSQCTCLADRLPTVIQWDR